MSFLKNLQKTLIPPRASSWQTMIWLWLFSWFMAALAVGFSLASTPQTKTFTNDFLLNMGWIFLIIGVHWWTMEQNWVLSGFPVGSWLTGALFCIFFFGWFWEELAVKYPNLPYISWPLISAAIAIRHKIYLTRLNPRIPWTRTLQEIIILSLINLVISCWLQFHFVIQDWIEDYPSLVADNFDRSAFILKIESANEETGRGVQMLEAIAQVLETKINNTPWPEVRNWLTESQKQLKNKKWPEVRNWLVAISGTQDAIKNQITVNLPKVEEDSLWYINSEIKEDEGEYKLVLKAIWRGPRSLPKATDITKTCQITRTLGQQIPRRSQLPQLPPEATGFMKC